VPGFCADVHTRTVCCEQAAVAVYSILLHFSVKGNDFCAAASCAIRGGNQYCTEEAGQKRKAGCPCCSMIFFCSFFFVICLQEAEEATLDSETLGELLLLL